MNCTSPKAMIKAVSPSLVKAQGKRQSRGIAKWIGALHSICTSKFVEKKEDMGAGIISP